MSTILSPAVDPDPISENASGSIPNSIFEKLNPNQKQAPSKIWDGARNCYLSLFGIILPASLLLYYACISFPSLYKHQPFGAINELLLLALLPACTAIAWFLVCRNRISQAATIGLMLGVQVSLTLSFWSIWLIQPPLDICWPESDAFKLIILLAPLSFGASFLLMLRIFGHESETFAAKSTRFAILGALLGTTLAFGPHLRTYFFDAYTQLIASEGRTETLEFLRNNATQEELENIFLLTPESTRYGLGCIRLFGQPNLYADANLYYRLTGKTLSPKLSSGPDQNLGMQVIGAKSAGLAVASSNIDGSFDSRSATGSLNWTMNFVNKSKVAQEARAILTLPPGAVVSRVTFWMNGAPHEAAFGSAEQTKGAYQWIVQRHRDPLLVTSAGEQKVFVQAYPVPAFGGHVQLRIGLKTPLAMSDLHHCSLTCPTLLASNFDDAANVEINLKGDGGNLITRTIRASSLPDQTFAIARPSSELQIASQDYYASGKQFILEKLVPKKLEPSGKTVFVIDASSSMQEHAKEIVDSIRSLKGSNLHVGDQSTVILAQEDPKEATEEAMLKEMPLEDGLKKLLASNFKGGFTNEYAVLQALQSAGTTANGTVVWVHGSQPTYATFPNLEMLGLFRHPKLIDFSVEEGPNDLKTLWENADSDNVIAYEIWQSHGSITANLKQLLHRLYDQSQIAYQPVQEIVHTLNGLKIDERPEVAAEFSALWANKAVEGLNKLGRAKDAQEIGTHYRIISKSSAATVLERASDYEAFQLRTSNYVDALEKPANAIATGSAGNPMLAGATNGMIGPQGSDATVITGVNTAGTVRVDNLAIVEGCLNFVGAALFSAALIFSVGALAFSWVPRFANKARKLFAGGILN